MFKPRRLAPGPGQESVWDYPRPPAMAATTRHVSIRAGGVEIADSRSAIRLLETSHPPTYYLPPGDLRMDLLQPSERRSFCEFKGVAIYYNLVIEGGNQRDIAWSYPKPSPGYEALRDHLAFYPTRVEDAFVNGERVRAQEGDFYGGWITSDVAGPFKGAPATRGW